MKFGSKLSISFFALILLTGFLVSPCCASLHSVSDVESSLDGGSHGDDEQPVAPNESEVHQDYGAGLANSVSHGETVASCPAVSGYLSWGSLKLSAKDQLYIRSWIFLPRPPVNEMLKVPIHNA